MDESEDLAEHIAAAARRCHLTVAVAESLTGGMIASRLAAAPAAATWFCGGIVAYSSQVKRDLLDVADGPVVSEVAALAMARGVAKLMGADLAIASTGVGGPQEQDHQPPGTVWLARYDRGRQHAELHHFDGADAGAICRRACRQALLGLAGALEARVTGR